MIRKTFQNAKPVEKRRANHVLRKVSQLDPNIQQSRGEQRALAQLARTLGKKLPTQSRNVPLTRQILEEFAFAANRTKRN